jgi:FlaA1/EpsC-like NDP-sugar epimerase/lipopolysaccharide/colanic/teichoic acid biosynthesis glycosyltransferase
MTHLPKQTGERIAPDTRPAPSTAGAFSLYNPYGKRLFDFLLSLIALILLSPLLLLLMILIPLQSRGSVFFYHVRIGRNMQPFRLIKFRTMTQLGGTWNGHCDTGGSERITWIGDVLRKTKLDELPSLINVLKGDMSLVGSRPEVAAYVKIYPDAFRRILRVRPGLTDDASVKYHDEDRLLAGHEDPETFYRNVILPDKLALAERYTANISLIGDLRIIWNTIKVVLSVDTRFKKGARNKTPERSRESGAGPGEIKKRRSIKSFLASKNIWIMIFGDAFLIAGAHCFSYLLRFDGIVPANEIQRLLGTLVWIVPLKVLCFWRFDLYRGMWRYTSLHDMYNLAKACAVSSALVLALLLITVRFGGFARSVFVIDLLATFLFTGGFRVGIRMHYHRKNRLDRRMFYNWQDNELKRVLIIGAGNAGEKLLREIRENEELFYDVAGFVDDNPGKLQRAIHGIGVLGSLEDLAEVSKRHKVDELIIAMPSATFEQMRAVVAACESTGLPFKTVPGLGELIQGRVSISALREVNYADLIGRQQVQLEVEEIGGYLTGRRVMVTGGAGSIGSELCRQIAAFKPQRLIILDNDETGVYETAIDLRREFPGLNVQGILGSVSIASIMARVFEMEKPQVIFHAAAYKHVSVLESHPWEAVYNNVVGTRNVLDLCARNGVERCVVVSTDKAVRPTSVMGATKRVDEILMQAYAAAFGTRFMAVRFGNVVGSAGSVIPLFRRQIREGGPLTVTDPEVTRYFMTIPEASRLILQAGAMGRGGEIFILKMGVPVKIAEMARDLIRLSGLKPEEDVQIEYTGLKPGEKLYEELITEGEGIQESRIEEIMVLTNGYPERTLEDIDRQIGHLVELAQQADADGIKAALKRLVPEYTPWEST